MKVCAKILILSRRNKSLKIIRNKSSPVPISEHYIQCSSKWFRNLIYRGQYGHETTFAKVKTQAVWLHIPSFAELQRKS